jgi:hypothetical protein
MTPNIIQPYCIFYNNKRKFNRPQQDAVFSLEIDRKSAKFYCLGWAIRFS